MNCPFCKISSMREVSSGAGVSIDRCLSCGAAWFDSGEIRELAEGRFPSGEETPAGNGAAEPRGERTPERMSRAWKEAAAISCPRCSSVLSAIDFRSTGIPVCHCRKCGGVLVPRASVADLSARFRFQRSHAALYQALGESLAGEVRSRCEREYGPDAAGNVRGEMPAPGLPLLVPLKDGAPPSGALPLVTWGLLGLAVTLHFFTVLGLGGMEGFPARLALPSGAGFGGTPPFVLWLAPFFHGGIVPLTVDCLFLFVLGDNVEDRMGRLPYLLFFLACGVIAGAAHVLWGKAGAPAALGSAGAVAGVLGAYLVFFPDVSISMYGMGRIVTLPAYLFACAWVVAVFLWSGGPVARFLSPAPYGLAGNLAGFGAGVGFAALWKTVVSEIPVRRS